ncbi:hypothetical protein ERO13_D09G070366v2 [Gossypium hirsutum]|uniref:Uncharacterized protein n=1 Tax=Gossypium mustelinum TaxID=34275 RepID=A0A5D2TJK2_GOSMU|nr:hypothetical protein ERO13_D09G070366v2 [Gossypium hirsutum]TYI64404.1 hypothetical protein E1A91_D09G086000v1 [Gossypium mustelinum]
MKNFQTVAAPNPKCSKYQHLHSSSSTLKAHRLLRHQTHNHRRPLLYPLHVTSLKKPLLGKQITWRNPISCVNRIA